MSKRPTLEDLGPLPPGSIVKGIAIPVAGEKPKVKRPKYRNTPTIYNGLHYDSKAEAARAKFLDASIMTWYIRQPRFHLGCPENVYVADFLVLGNEHYHVEDVKGVETPKFRRDKKLWMAYGKCQLWVIRGKEIEYVNGGLDPIARLHGTQGKSSMEETP